MCNDWFCPKPLRSTTQWGSHLLRGMSTEWSKLEWVKWPPGEIWPSGELISIRILGDDLFINSSLFLLNRVLRSASKYLRNRKSRVSWIHSCIRGFSSTSSEGGGGHGSSLAYWAFEAKGFVHLVTEKDTFQYKLGLTLLPTLFKSCVNSHVLIACLKHLSQTKV